MKEFYLIPVNEYNEMLKPTNDVNNKRKILNSDDLPTNVILEVFNNLLKKENVENVKNHNPSTKEGNINKILSTIKIILKSGVFLMCSIHSLLKLVGLCF